MVTSSRTTSAIRRSRTDLAAVSTALRAASAHPSVLTPMTSVTRYTLSAMRLPSVGGSRRTLSGCLRACVAQELRPDRRGAVAAGGAEEQRLRLAVAHQLGAQPGRRRAAIAAAVAGRREVVGAGEIAVERDDLGGALVERLCHPLGRADGVVLAGEQEHRAVQRRDVRVRAGLDRQRDAHARVAAGVDRAATALRVAGGCDVRDVDLAGERAGRGGVLRD